jgi:imidazolonepropionase-like amidohydrolase
MLRRTATAVAACLALAAAPAPAQDLIKKAPPQEHPTVVVNATIHPISSEPIEHAWLLFDKGVIVEIGTGTPPSSADTLVVEGAGRHVYPGLISAYSQLGLTEIQAVRATRDMDEVGVAGVSPEVFAAVSVNPDSTLIPVTRSNGVLIAGVFPTGGAIPGRASVMRLDGWTWEDMAILRDAGVVVSWPWMRPVTAWWMDQSDEEQQRQIRERTEAIESAFRQARAYHAAKSADPLTPTDLRWEAMGPALRGDAPVFIEANEYDQIVAAVTFAQREGLRPIIIGGRDAPLCADLLRRHQVPVIITGTFRFPKRDDSPYNDAYTLPARLEAAGITWALSGGDDTAHERNLPYAAAMAVAHGLDEDAAIRALTLSAAQIFGIDDRYGSLEKGKSATFIVTDGNPLEVTTNVHAAFIDGRRIDLRNKQTQLEEKYREKYEQIGGFRR